MGVKKRMAKIQAKAVVWFDQITGLLAKCFGTNVCLLSRLLQTLFLNSLVGKDKKMNAKKNCKMALFDTHLYT